MNRTSVLLTLLCGLLLCQDALPFGAAAFQDDQSGIRFPRTTSQSAETKDGPVTWPMKMADARPVPLVEAHVNGEGPFLFYLDTGAGTTTLNTEFVEKLQLPKDGKTSVRGPGTGPGIDADIVTVDRLQMGDIEIREFEAAAFDRSQFSGGQDIAGSLGLGIFADLPVTLDYPNNQIIVGGDELGEADGDAVLDCDFAAPVPTFEIQLADKTFRAAFDSGFAGLMLVGEESTKDLTFAGELATIGKARSVSGEVEIKRGQVEGELKVGNQLSENPSLTIMPVLLTDQELCVLGYAWGREMAVTYDRKNGRVAFHKSAAVNGEEMEPTSEFAGKYGMREVFEQDGKLMYRREGGIALELKPVGEDTFELTLPPNARSATPLPNVRFERDDDKRVKGFSLVRDGEVEEYVEKNKD